MHPICDIKKYILAGVSALNRAVFACISAVATVLTPMDWVLITPINKKYLQTLSGCIILRSQFRKYKDAAVGERLRLMAAYWDDT